jgi:hypothetical protein
LRDSTNNAPVLVGSSTPLFSSEQGQTLDAAPPVIGSFLFQSNACKPAGTPSLATFMFSEPVQLSSIPYFSSIRGLTLISRNRNDNTFTQTLILRGEKGDQIENEGEAWNLGGSSTMSYRLEIKPESVAVFIPGMTQVRFTSDPAIPEFKDLTGNSGCASAVKPATLLEDKDRAPAICTINGNTNVYRDQAAGFTWTQTDSGPIPNFHFFGFTVNLQTLIGNLPRNVIQTNPVSVGGKSYIVCDFDSTIVLIDSRVNIYDLLGNLTASPASHASLQETYTGADIRKFLGVDVSASGLLKLTPEEIVQYYSISPALNPADPDTLRPIYPPSFTIGYRFMLQNCGPSTASGKMCVPAWNCLNAKGRLVAPGGYVAVQHMRTGRTLSEAIRRILVKGGVAH